MAANPVDLEKMIAQIDLNENAAYIVKDGQLTKIRAKKSGNDTLYWQDGKVLDVVHSNRTRIAGQEVI
ncbi:hypothetical protein [Heyndrickxia ginsengihumi]|uniref:hypothetical protein n=1 Tax=Heyndrickxia ginsengihumi TaxID=363870 RepID=UPI000472B5AC|nr:hypothetical protein [Heyndrickxia ginsengihumi]